MAEEIDLSDPKHLANLLRVALPDFEDEAPEQLAQLVDALRSSDNPAFAHIGKGEQVESSGDLILDTVDPDAEAKPPEPDPKQEPPDTEGDAEQAVPPIEQLPPKHDEEPAPSEADAMAMEQPLDLGGQGQLLGPEQVGATEAAGPPVRALRGWSEIDRWRAKGKHAIYALAATHDRFAPIEAKFTGQCQSVRVILPAAKPPRDGFIGTWTGTVEVRDHLLFSTEEVRARYRAAFSVDRSIERVELITGARFRGRRFSPVSIYLAYEKREDDRPIYYFLEAGSAKGQPKALYCARDMDATILAKSGFSFTPMACKDNWYDGGLAMDQSGREPACVYLTVAQQKDGGCDYLRLSVQYDRDRELERVVHPFELQIEAALRVVAISKQAGCRLATGSGGELQNLGELVEALMPWDERPKGTASPLEQARYCGCSKIGR